MDRQNPAASKLTHRVPGVAVMMQASAAKP